MLKALVRRYAHRKLLGIIEALLKGCVYTVKGMATEIPASTGVKQGGVLSPVLYSIYVDAIFARMEARGTGCYVGSRFMGIIMYADDVVLMSPTSRSLEGILLTFIEFCAAVDLKLNFTKSDYAIFGEKRACCTCSIEVDGKILVNVDHVKHLGLELYARTTFACGADER